MKTLFIHVGLHKTATTSLQHFFEANKEVLQDSNIYYPKTGKNKEGMHHQFPAALFDRDHQKYTPQADLSELLTRLRQEIEPYDNILISSEVFSEKINHNRAIAFQSIVDQVKIIIYLRRQDVYIESAYRFLVKIGKFKGPFEAFKYQGVFSLDYWEKVEMWARLFGKENIIVRIYEKGQFEGGDIFHDFLSALDTPWNDQFQLPRDRSNISLTRDLLEFRRLLNLIGVSNDIIPALEAIALQHKADEDRPYRHLSPHERSMLVEKYADTNARIAKEYLHREDGILFYAPLISEPWVSYPGLSPDTTQRVMRYLRQHYFSVFNRISPLVYQASLHDETHVRQAGLILSEALNSLEPSTLSLFRKVFQELKQFVKKQLIR